MLDWLTQSLANGQPIPWDLLIGRLLLAWLLGGLVAVIYGLTHRKDEALAWSFVSTLVLLAILIAMVTQVIGENVARAFSLVGALSIIRFRTVVEDTRDTAFVIFSVVVGMAVGAGHVEVAMVGLVVVGVAAAGLRFMPRQGHAGPHWQLNIRIGIAQSAEAVLTPIFRDHFAFVELRGTATGRQGASIDLNYKVKLRPTDDPVAIVSELNRVEGVQNVELRCG